MATFDLKKDWPIVAAAGAAVVGVVMATKQSGPEPVVLGGGVPAGYEAAISAQATLGQAALGARTAAFTTLVGEYGATERTRLETKAVKQTVKAQLAAQQQVAQYNLLGSIAAGIFNLFSWETTMAGERGREARRSRMVAAYSRV